MSQKIKKKIKAFTLSKASLKILSGTENRDLEEAISILSYHNSLSRLKYK